MITDDAKLRALLTLPWTFLVSKDQIDGDLIGRVAEIPSVVAVAEDAQHLEPELWEALRTALAGYLHFGDAIPLPKDVPCLPWEAPARPTPRQMRAVLTGSAWDPRPSDAPRAERVQSTQARVYGANSVTV